MVNKAARRGGESKGAQCVVQAEEAEKLAQVV
jgi:hypothetical protein